MNFTDLQIKFDARGSLLELETLLLVGRDLNYLKTEDAVRLLNHTAEVGRLLNGLLNSVQR